MCPALLGRKEARMLTFAMLLLGLGTFAAMAAFVAFCDRV
jgi:hypothetical protein